MLRRAGIATAAAELLLARMRAKIDDLCRERDSLRAAAAHVLKEGEIADPHRHMLGALSSAIRPTRLRTSTHLSPFVAASRILEATCARAPVSYWDMFSHTSSKTARRSAVVSASNIGDPQRQDARERTVA